MRCSLCGHYFTEEEAAGSCAGCPMRRGCGRLRCPHCGYETTRIPRWLGRLMRKEDRTAEEGTLAAVAPGGRAFITGIEATEDRLVRKLMAMGLVPGTEVHVLRSKPGVVLRVGRAELAIDRETAAKIGVEIRT